MKKIIAFVTLLAILAQSLGQVPAPPVHTKDYYLQKSKSKKAGAWILLVGGALMATIGFTKSRKVSNDLTLSFNDALGAGLGWDIVALTGCSFVVVSVPLFISGKKDARKAASIAF